MPEPNTTQPPLPIGTPVEINIAEGLAIAQGVLAAAEYDDGWLYRIDITGGDDCRAHRNDAGELWVCEHEVHPKNAEPVTEHKAATPHTVEIVDNLLVVLDRDGNGCDCHELRGLARAKHQLQVWQRDYAFDYATALRAVSEFFATEPKCASPQNPNAELRAVDLRVEQIAR
jgi:hypothetical protein